MPILYKGITAILALTGCVSLLITGELNLLMCAGGLTIFPGYYRFFRGYAQASRFVAAVLAQAALLVFLADAFIISADVFLAVAHMTITFQGIKSLDLKEPWDHLQVYFMSLLQLVIASELTRALTFGVIFVIFMALLVTAMVLSHFLKEGALGRVRLRRPVVVIVLLTLVCTALFFVVIPRTPQRFIGKSHYRGIKTVGFSDRVDFGSFGDVKLDPTVVMRIEMNREINSPYYWRGISLDTFDGASWMTTSGPKTRVYRSDGQFIFYPADRDAAIEQRIFLEPLDSDVILGLSRIAAVAADTPYLQVDDAKGIYMPGRVSRRIKYTAYSDLAGSFESDEKGIYLRLPAGFEKVVNLGKTISTQAGTDEQKAVAIEQYLKRNYTYSLKTAPPPPGMSVIEDFLFSARRGFCEHYATSMVIMLRGIGIPARIVNGFYGGERNEFGNYIIVRQSDAHSWVEAVINDKWKRFDPTPAVAALHPPAYSLFLDSIRLQWTRYVVGFSFDDQKDIARTLTIPFRVKEFPAVRIGDIRAFVIVVFCAALMSIVLYLTLRKLRVRRYSFVSRAYLEFRDMLKHRGVKVTESMTAGDIRAATRSEGFGREAEEFLDMYETHRFGSREMDSRARGRYKELLTQFKRHKRRRD